MRAGNTIESFHDAVELGVDMIEFDVLGVPDGRVLVAHDLEHAQHESTLSLDECLDAFTRPPLDRVELDCDLKTIGSGERLVEELRHTELVERTMVSGLDVPGMERMRRLEPELRIGWTYPKVRRDWMQSTWALPATAVAVATMRRRLPGLVLRTFPRIGVQSVWPFWKLITRRLVEAAEEVGAEVNAWTVDDVEAIGHLRDLGVHGVCTNDPRLFAELD